MSKEKEQNKKEKEHHKEEEETRGRRRKANNMPGQFEGRGPQQNSVIGYDPLEDI